VKDTGPSPDCAAAREAIHDLLDAEIVDARRTERLQAHLAACEACRELGSDLRSIQGTLRALPSLRLPDAVLEGVWKEADSARRPGAGSRWTWLAAAAAVVLLAVVGVRRLDPAGKDEPDAEELLRASRQARMVLRLASEALQRAKDVAVDDVLGDEVSPALRRLPIDWPTSEAVATRRGGA
jgi:hypothetical protein